jgi:uroporphyrinogen-III synthase
MRVVVTRPQPQANAWVSQLVDRGVNAVALPLLQTLPPPDASAVQAAWRDLTTFQGAVFVSPAAVQAWMSAKPEGTVWPASVWAAAPGPGTAAALAAHQVTTLHAPAKEAPQFDSEALWAALPAQSWQGQRILIVHGGAGREWLTQQWQAQGAQVHKVQAYQRQAATLDDAQRATFRQALDDAKGHAWLFSSSEIVDIMVKHAQPLGAEASLAGSTALCTHPSIAARARALESWHVHEVQPTVDALVSWVGAQGRPPKARSLQSGV